MDTNEEKPVEAMVPPQPETTEPSPQPTLPAKDTLFTTDSPAPMPPKRSAKRWVTLILILIVVSAGLYLYMNKKPAVKTASSKVNSFPHITLPNQPKQTNSQYSSQYFSTGYVQYDARKLKTISADVPKIEPILPKSADASDKEVVFMADLSAVSTKRLIMYDVASGISYLVNEDKSVGNYYNAHIMSNHYVVFAVLSQSDPVTNTTAIKSFDLDTGVTKTILSGKSSEIPIALCCSVSPDGLRMAIPATNTLLIYQAGEDKPTSFNVGLKVFPDTKGSAANDDYAASQRNGNYPGLVWLDDNKVMFAKGNPYAWTVDSSGSHLSTSNNGLAIYNLADNTTKDVARTSNAAIKQFWVDGSTIIFTVVNKDLNGLTILKYDNFDQVDAQPLEQTMSSDYQSKVFYDPGGKKLYIQPSGSDGQTDTKIIQILDLQTGETVKTKLGTFPYPSLEGIIGPNKLVVNNSYSVNNDYNIYDSKTQAVEHLFSFSQQ